MVTNNFKQAVKLMLVNHSSRSNGGILISDPNGNTKYLIRFVGWPVSIPTQLRVSAAIGDGIVLGAGSTPPTINDFNLESRITSGLSGSVSVDSNGVDGSGNPQIKMLVSVTNTGSSDITIGEIGLFVTFYTANDAQGSGLWTNPIMIDRTTLNNPVTVPAGESTVITYTLKTVIE